MKLPASPNVSEKDFERLLKLKRAESTALRHYGEMWKVEAVRRGAEITRRLTRDVEREKEIFFAGTGFQMGDLKFGKTLTTIQSRLPRILFTKPGSCLTGSDPRKRQAVNRAMKARGTGPRELSR